MVSIETTSGVLSWDCPTMRIYLPANLEENVFWIYLDSPLLYAGVTMSFLLLLKKYAWYW